MKVAALPFEFVDQRVAYDPESGLLAYKCGKRAGEPCSKRDHYGYVVVNINGRSYRAHQIAWLLTHGRATTGPIDHINGVRTDNRLCNLRLADDLINNQNRSAPQRNNRTSKFLGVSGWASWPGKFRAQIKVMGKKIHLGVFDTEEAAAQAYLEAKSRMHVGFVRERFE